MKPFRKMVIEALDNTVHLALFYGLFAMLMYMMTGDTGDLVRLAFIALPFVGNFVLRRVFKNFWVSLIAHICIPLMTVFLVQELHPRIVWTGATVIIALYSLGHYFRREPSSGAGFMVFGGGAIVVLSIVAARMGYWPLLAIYPPLLLFMGIGRTVLSHMLQMDVSLEAVQLSSAQPVERIISFNYKLMLGLGVVMLALTLVVFSVLVEPIMNIIADRFHFPWTIHISDVEYTVPPDDRGATQNWSDSLMQFDEETEPTLLAQVMQIIFRVISVLAVVVFVAVIIILVFTTIMNALNKEHFTQPEHISDTEDKREFILPRRVKTTGRRRKPHDEHPVRRLFRETVSRHMKMGVPIDKSDTPTDMVGRIESEDITKLANDYADVRYRNTP